MTGLLNGGSPPSLHPDRRNHWALPHIEEALHGLRFGQVIVTVQDGVVIQVERIERRRFPRSARHGGG
jgi:hypothetical protein